MKKNFHYILVFLPLFVFLTFPKHTEADSCIINILLDSLTVNPPAINTCPGKISVTAKFADTIQSGTFTIVAIDDTTGAEQNLGTLTATAPYQTVTVNNLGNFDTNGHYTIKLKEGSAGTICSINSAGLTVQNCTAPTATPTPVAGSVCIPYGTPNKTCTNSGSPGHTNVPSECCPVSGWDCLVDSALGGFTCQTPAVVGQPSNTPTLPPFDPCSKLAEPGKTDCQTCQNSGSVYTAIGCVPLDPSAFTGSFIRILFGLAGGVGFLLILYGSFLCLTSRGNPQQAQACRETITAAIVGIIMVLLSIAIVQILFSGSGILPGILPGTLWTK